MVSKGSPLYGLEEPGRVLLVQGLDFRLDKVGEDAPVRGVDADVIDDNGLLEGLVEHSVDAPHRLG